MCVIIQTKGCKNKDPCDPTIKIHVIHTFPNMMVRFSPRYKVKVTCVRPIVGESKLKYTRCDVGLVDIDCKCSKYTLNFI